MWSQPLLPHLLLSPSWALAESVSPAPSYLQYNSVGRNCILPHSSHLLWHCLTSTNSLMFSWLVGVVIAYLSLPSPHSPTLTSSPQSSSPRSSNSYTHTSLTHNSTPVSLTNSTPVNAHLLVLLTAGHGYCHSCQVITGHTCCHSSHILHV